MPDRPSLDRNDWLNQVTEDIIDPDRPIIDPHHHLWDWGPGNRYLLDELRSDTGAGHNVLKTVYMECGSFYRPDGPDQLMPVGETAGVAAIAATSRELQGAEIAGIVAHADLRLPLDELDEVLDQHEAAGEGLFRGIRHSGSRPDEPETLTIPGRGPEGLYDDPDFRRGVDRLGERGLTYDTWHYHHQNADFARLAAALPGTTMVLDHFGTPVGVGKWAGRHDEIFPGWQADIDAIAANGNVVAKLGGLAMPDNGFGWHTAERPPTSDEFVAAQERWYLHTIEAFGPDRCMFESNFPVDRWSISYPVLWNGLKKIAARFRDDEQHALFWGTAERVYRL